MEIKQFLDQRRLLKSWAIQRPQTWNRKTTITESDYFYTICVQNCKIKHYSSSIILMKILDNK